MEKMIQITLSDTKKKKEKKGKNYYYHCVP